MKIGSSIEFDVNKGMPNFASSIFTYLLPFNPGKSSTKVKRIMQTVHLLVVQAGTHAAGTD